MADETLISCLTGYIRASEEMCQQPTEPSEDEWSGLLLTHLPGISLDSMESLADDETKTFLGVWEVIEKRALLQFRSALMIEVKKCHSACNIEVIDCIACENQEILATALWYLIGVEFCNEILYSHTISRYTTVDRKNAKQMRDDFFMKFQVELENAVSGMDVSECIEGDHNEGGSVFYQESSLC